MNNKLHIDKYLVNGIYVSDDGIGYTDATSYILQHIFKFCGCGKPQQALIYIKDVLQFIDDKHNDPIHETNPRVDSAEWKQWCKDIDIKSKQLMGNAEYFTYYILDKLGLTEHGGSVPGWLTLEGEELLHDLKIICNE